MCDQNTETSYSKTLWRYLHISLHMWRYSKPDWMGLQATFSSWPPFRHEVWSRWLPEVSSSFNCSVLCDTYFVLMVESKQLKNCDHSWHLLFWSKYYLGCTVPHPLKISDARTKIRNCGGRFLGGGERWNCSLCYTQFEVGWRTSLSCDSNVVSFTSIKFLRGGGGKRDRERGLNLADVDRPVLKLILLL